MALIKLTAIVDNISGKLNGTVFARNKGGHYMRSKSKPTNPRTFLQSAQRAIFGAVAQAWRSLSQAQRNAWDAAVPDFKYQNRLGDSKTLSGFALHQQLNNNLLLIGEPVITTPPMPQEMYSPVSAEAYLQVGPTKVELSAQFIGAESASTMVAIFATSALSPGVKNASNRYRFLTARQASDLTGPTALDLAVLYETKFGTPPVNSKVAFRIISISAISGEASAPIDFAGDVVQGP